MYDLTMSAYRAKMAQAIGGTKAVPKIATFVVGTGGVDANGNPIAPVDGETKLYNQVLSKPVTGPVYPTATSVQFSVEIDPADLPVKTPICEMGLIDAEGTFVYHGTFYVKNTDGTTTMPLTATLQL